MSIILIAALSFVVGAITGAVALLAFAAWTTRDVDEIEHRYRAAKDWKYDDEAFSYPHPLEDEPIVLDIVEG
jgi:hypothetical protein